MKNRGWIICFVICLSLFISASILGDVQSVRVRGPITIRGISPRPSTMKTKLIEKCIGILGEEITSDISKSDAAFILGQLQAQQAIGILIENIDMRSPFWWSKGTSMHPDDYPVATALVKIGEDNSILISELLMKTIAVGGKDVRVSVGVLVAMKGEEQTKKLIEEHLLSEENEEYTKNIRKALECVIEFRYY